MQPFLEPARPGIQPARVAVEGAGDPEAAWRQLAERGVVPRDWLSSARRFVHEPLPTGAGHPRPTRDPVFAPHKPWPQTIEQSVLFASDVEGVLAAEAAAIELGRRLAPGQPPLCDRVLWWSVPRGQFGRVSTDTRPGVIYALLFALEELFGESAQASGLRAFGDALRLAQAWRETPVFAGRPNPFEPLAVIEGAGYSALEYVGATGAFVLVAPSD